MMLGIWWAFRMIAATFLTLFVSYHCREDIRLSRREPFPGWSVSIDVAFYLLLAIGVLTMWSALV